MPCSPTGSCTDVTGPTADESRALFVLAAQGAHAALGLDAALGSALREVMATLPAPHRPAADLGVLQDVVFFDRRPRLRYRHGGGQETHLVADRVRSATVPTDAVRRRPAVNSSCSPTAWRFSHRSSHPPGDA